MSQSPDGYDPERFPTLTTAGREMLRFLGEHPRAPIYRNRSGNRLTTDEVQQIQAWEREVLAARVGWRPGEPPEWIRNFTAACLKNVPFYRRYGSPPAAWTDLPTISRADLSHDVAQFVPDEVPIARLLQFSTSGTTGHPLLIPSLPIVAARYLAFHKRALRRFGIELRHGRGEVGVVLLGWQRKCFTYVSVTPNMDESGLAKINLHPNDWRDPDDRAEYLDALAPEVLAGDPLSFTALLDLPLKHQPRALLSTSMALLPGLRVKLERNFRCPVLNIYSMNEAGPIAVADDAAGGHVLLQHCLYVEILDPEGNSLPPGERGEITLTGGFNDCLPLLRYRTGDYASLSLEGPEPVLVGITGRPPVRFRTQTGEWINNLEVTHVMGRFALAQFTLHQDAGGHLQLRLPQGSDDHDAIARALRMLFGAEQEVKIEEQCQWLDKVVQYTSDLAGALP